ncbi:hypothetical protein BN946_scf184845.g9 [Trametes cinnabarina]|uniref:Uncharacterized protein n=1 Tax=Pycnoporus cinnabarinus TaxID=5643 RepID=A0A060SFV5_PYCCI|nr:hypothetical protein BN946_scf184845.g9 [Trametes cinnabarina]
MAHYAVLPRDEKPASVVYGRHPSHPSNSLPPPYARECASSSQNDQRYSLSQAAYCFAPSPYGDPTAPLPGDSPKGFKQHMKNLAPGKSPTKLLDPPPLSFTRMPPGELPYGSFPTMEVMCKGTTLDKGFPYGAPMCGVLPHPFVTHDVNESDWRWFVHDVRIAGSLSPMNRVVAGALPILFPFGLVLSVAAALGTEQYIKRRKRGPVSELIDHWNSHFFHPRSVHVALSKGSLVNPSGFQTPPQRSDGKWRLVISFRPHALATAGQSYHGDIVGDH